MTNTGRVPTSLSGPTPAALRAAIPGLKTAEAIALLTRIDRAGLTATISGDRLTIGPAAVPTVEALADALPGVPLSAVNDWWAHLDRLSEHIQASVEEGRLVVTPLTPIGEVILSGAAD